MRQEAYQKWTRLLSVLHPTWIVNPLLNKLAFWWIARAADASCWLENEQAAYVVWRGTVDNWEMRCRCLATRNRLQTLSLGFDVPRWSDKSFSSSTTFCFMSLTMNERKIHALLQLTRSYSRPSWLGSGKFTAKFTLSTQLWWRYWSHSQEQFKKVYNYSRVVDQNKHRFCRPEFHFNKILYRTPIYTPTNFQTNGWFLKPMWLIYYYITNSVA